MKLVDLADLLTQGCSMRFLSMYQHVTSCLCIAICACMCALLYQCGNANFSCGHAKRSPLFCALGWVTHSLPKYIMVRVLFAAPSNSTPGQPKAADPNSEAPAAPKAPQLPKIEAPKLEAPKPLSLPSPPQPSALPQQEGELQKQSIQAISSTANSA